MLEPPYTSLGWCGSCRFAVLEPPQSSASSGWFKHSEPQRTYTNHTSTELARCVGCFCTRLGGSSTSNLHEPHHHSFSRVVQAQRTYTNHTITVLKVCRALVRGCCSTSCVGCFCTTSGWFKHSEPTRTTPSQSSRCVGCFYTTSGWFKHFEPHRTYTILTITELARCVGYLCTRSGWFKHSEPLRT